MSKTELKVVCPSCKGHGLIYPKDGFPESVTPCFRCRGGHINRDSMTRREKLDEKASLSPLGYVQLGIIHPDFQSSCCGGNGFFA